MKEAFIIMHIGNDELDKMCKEAIVPALKSCGLDPKRVDKHNVGRLLQSEVADFIKSAEIIVADLTNERPNCYLEVGYAMGRDRFQNLILTARKDHHPDDPNGHKIHFDLGGYDTIFWDPDNLKAFKEELEKKTKHRLETMANRTLPKGGLTPYGWIVEHQEKSLVGLSKSGKSEFMEISMIVPDSKLDLSLKQLLETARKAQIEKFGWPIGIVLGNGRPLPEEGGIFVDNIAELDKKYDFWSIRKDGTFYLLKSMFEADFPKLGLIFYDTRIIRITEALLHATRLYSGLGLPRESKIIIKIRHGNIKDHNLGSSLMKMPFPGHKCGVADITSEVETNIDEIEKDLIGVVKKFTSKLFEMFEFYEPEEHALQRTIVGFAKGIEPVLKT